MRHACLVALSIAVVLGAAAAGRAAAQEAEPEGPSGREIVVAYNTGFRFGISPGIFIPVNGESVGFSIAGDLRYGYEVGPVILAPGGRLAGYFPSELSILAGFATGRVTFPVGPVGPYVLGGLGPGWVSKPSEAGLAWMAGGGVMVHIGTRFGIGAEATYQAITGTLFKALFVGPSLLIGF